MVDTKISAFTTAANLTGMILPGESGGINYAYTVALFDARYAQVTGATFTGSNTYNVAAGNPAYNIFSTAGGLRWEFGKNGTSESGSNLGSDFILARFNDFGSLIDNPVTVYRSTGIMTLTQPVDISAGTSGQIKFPGAQNPSSNVNTLDDYTEGTWSPVIIGTTTGGTGTYTTQAGFFTKVGRLVHWTARLVWAAHTGTGNMTIGGLPYTVNHGASIDFRVSGITMTNAFIQGYHNEVATTVTLETVASGGVPAAIAMQGTGTIYASGTYVVT